MKRIAILGSTGSIGTNALDVIGRNPDKFKVVGLTANANFSFLARQVRRFNVTKIAIGDKNRFEDYPDDRKAVIPFLL